MLNLGIAVTVADAAESVETFIRYHLKIGFVRIYLFIDDCDIETEDIASKFSQVKVFTRGEWLTDRWSSIKYRNKVNDINLVDKEVMIRQELNFQVAFEYAKEEGIDWLMHIDIDELFYPNGLDIFEHFKNLQIRDYRSITYLNYESISTELEAVGVFESSEYFKVNCFKNKHWFYTEEQEQFLKNTNWISDKYFRYYQNGKSCVSTFGNNLYVYDVHSILGDGSRKMGNKGDPIILHFPCATYKEFKRKYKRLGEFPDSWRGKKRVGKYIDEVHLNARDLFVGNHTECEREDFYSEKFVLTEEKIKELEDLKLARRITFHKEIIESLEN